MVVSQERKREYNKMAFRFVCSITKRAMAPKSLKQSLPSATFMRSLSKPAVPAKDLPHAEPAPRQTLADFPRWRLLRIDDNGNEFEIAVYPEEEAAVKACVEFEERGHKQTYFVRRAAP
jgi:ribosome maturation protein Sdo1